MDSFKKIYRVGLDKTDNALTELRTCITNLMIIFTVPYVLYFIPFIYNKGHYFVAIAYAALTSILLGAYYLNSLNKKRIATKIVFITSIILVIIPIISFGRSTELQAFFPIMMIFVFILFDRTYELFIFSTLTAASFLATFYTLEIQKPLLDQRAMVYDYYLNMGFAIVSSGFLSYIMMNILRNYNSQKDAVLKKLAEQNSIINKQNEEMELFTIMASHDLKTPARTITSFLGLLKKTDDFKNSNSEEYLNMALSGAHQLNNLITGISSFRNTGDDKTDFRYEPTDKILKQVMNMMGLNNINDKTQTETISINSSNLHNLKVANTDLHHIFQNLIENALKYNTHKNKVINIDSKISESTITFSFSDNGLGIEKEYLDYIFDPFKKLHSAEKYDSTGLGLAICRKIISNYNGSIKAESVGLGHGTTFIISFPIALLAEYMA